MRIDGGHVPLPSAGFIAAHASRRRRARIEEDAIRAK